MLGMKDTLETLLTVLKANKDEFQFERQRFFSHVIKPSFTSLTEIHKDYITNFTHVLGLMEGTVRPKAEIVTWLREKSAEYSASRTLVRDIGNRATNFDNYFKRRSSFPANSKQLFMDFYSYCDAISDYFHTGNWKTTSSWYSDFLDTFEGNVKRFNLRLQKFGEAHGLVTDSDFDSALAGGSEAAEKLRQLCDIYTMRAKDLENLGYTMSDTYVRQLITEELPSKYAAVARGYDKLRSMCDFGAVTKE